MQRVLIFLLLLASIVTAQQILVVKDNFVLINTDQKLGSIGSKLNVYRSVQNQFYKIGTVQVVRIQNGKTAAQIVQKDIPLQKGDLVRPAAQTKTYGAPSKSPVHSSIGLNYRNIAMLGDAKDEFITAYGAELYFEQHLYKNFALRGMLTYSYMEWERPGFVYQYAEPEAYAVAVSPVLCLPLAHGVVELSVAPVFGIALIPVWLELKSGYYNVDEEEQIKPEVQFYFGTDACIRINFLKHVGAEIGVRWENLDVMGGFSEYDYIPDAYISHYSGDEISIETTALIMRMGLVFHF